MSEETTLSQYKVACDRAWEVVKERDADVSALKRRIQQLENVRRQNILLKNARQSLRDTEVDDGINAVFYMGVPLDMFDKEDLLRLINKFWETNRWQRKYVNPVNTGS